MLVENFLQPHIQQEVLLQALKAKLKKDQLDGIKKQLDAMFDSETLPKLLKDKGYVSPVELERELQKHGSSIETIRAGSRNRQLAQQYHRNQSSGPRRLRPSRYPQVLSGTSRGIRHRRSGQMGADPAQIRARTAARRGRSRKPGRSSSA